MAAWRHQMPVHAALFCQCLTRLGQAVKAGYSHAGGAIFTPRQGQSYREYINNELDHHLDDRVAVVTLVTSWCCNDNGHI